MVVAVPSKYFKSTHNVLSLLDQPCLTLRHINQIQSHLTVSGAISDPFAAGKLVAFLAISPHGDLSHAHTLFRHLPNRSTFLWNTIIRGFVENNQVTKALSLYKQMMRSGFSPNNYTFSFVLRACVELSEISLGLVYQAQSIELGWERYDFVRNGLVHLYASCGFMESAHKLFDTCLNRDVVTWTAMVSGYVNSGEIGVARELFDEMPVKNEVSWGAIINGYVQFGLFKKALEHFNEMQLAGLQPDHAGIVGALSACASLGALDQGRWIHAYVGRRRMGLDRVLGTALVDMYAKCGCVEAARCVFDEMPNRDVYAFTSLISGLANHGQGSSAIELLSRMKDECVKPNDVTFTCLLSACSRTGLVEEGLEIFEIMSSVYGIEPGVQHYGCLVDLLGRVGMLEQAKKVVREMPMEPDSYVLGALLNACSVHGDAKLGKEMVGELVERSLDRGGVHVLLSNIYASADQWHDVEKVREEMDKKKVKKVPGCSVIEVDGVVFEFVAGDRSHTLMEEINFLSMVTDKHLKSHWMDDDEMISVQANWEP